MVKTTLDAPVRNLSPFVRTHKTLQHWIEEGVLQPGERLPSEQDLAERLNVSRTTIRAVLEKLEEEKIVEPLQGRGRIISPSLPARRRTLRGTVGILDAGGNIGLAPRHFSSGWADYIPLGILDASSKRGWHTLVLSVKRLLDEGAEHLLSEGLMGMLVLHEALEVPAIPPLLRIFQKENLPVIIQSDGLHLEGFDQVLSDHSAGAYDLTKWLIKKGRQRILRLWEIPLDGNFPGWLAERDEGFEKASREALIEPLPAHQVRNPLVKTEQVHEFELMTNLVAGHLGKLIGGGMNFDAIITTTDGHVPHICAALRQLGITPGSDVLVAGYDDYWSDVPEQEWENTPPAATVNKLNRSLGTAMVEVLQERLEHPLVTELICRKVRPELKITCS